MSPIITIGNASVGLAVGFSLFGMVSFLAAHRTPKSAAWGRGAVYGNFILMTIANLAMVYALLGNDFGVSYVAHVGARETPRWISAISLWSSLEGSILLWGWILSAYAAICTYLYRGRQESMMPWVGFVLLMVELFFFLLLALPANPFLPMMPIPENGPGPNPLLQNHWLMAIHPPCLYIGYIGMTIPFAFAIAALMEKPSPLGRRGWSASGGPGEGDWVFLSRPWLLFAWSFLSMAIVLGGWWSYAVLGWGGYWAWDPVENASFMPWLSATALIHSMMVQEQRKILPVWNLSLAILTFLLTLLGTFLTRSGLLDSVHSFTESSIGPWFLIFIGIMLAGSLTLLLWRAPRQPGEKIENLLSLEVMFLFNNLLFLSFCLVVLLGTLYPLVVEAIQGTRISVGQPYFNQMTVPMIGMILLLMGVGWATPWRKGTLASLYATAKKPLLLACLPVLISLLAGGRDPRVIVFVSLAGLAFFIMLLGLFRPGPRRYGGFIAHSGALIIIVAVTLSSIYKKDRELTLKQGESVAMGNYTLTFRNLRAVQAPQRYEIRAMVDLENRRAPLTPLVPQMNFYPNSREPIGSPAVRSTLQEDLYLTLLNFEKDGSEASFRLLVMPAVSWIWIGGAVVMVGGLTSLLLRKRAKEGQ